MKRYLLFSGDEYYAAGGWVDLVGWFDTVERATNVAKRIGDDWWHVVDAETGKTASAAEWSYSKAGGFCVTRWDGEINADERPQLADRLDAEEW